MSTVDDNERREALFRLGHALIKLKNDLAYLPGGAPDSRISEVMLFCIPVLKEFQVKTLRLQFVDKHLDAYPLACLYNLGVQILALREAQHALRDNIYRWKEFVKAAQASNLANSDDIGVALAETHEFLVFATLANRIHPVSTLTEFSIAHAVQKARESQFLKEAAHVVTVLKAAFSIQKELERSGASGPGGTYVISNAIPLSKTIIRVAGEWYKYYELSIPDHEKVCVC